MKEIKKVAVIGAGLMGSSIAAHIANSGTEVLLFDVVPSNATDNNILPKLAIEKMLKAKPALLTHKSKVNLITAVNVDDDLKRLKEADWIIEAVIEDIDIKREVYSDIEKHSDRNTPISSNTSTIPLKELIEEQSADFKKCFLITHFFNPPRYMRLLEIVGSKKTNPQYIENIADFCNKKLGKTIIKCKDAPGFVANRIGCFWLMAAIDVAINIGITVDEADYVVSKPFGIPKTGAFGLLDLIGLDLIPLIAESLAESLPDEDEFQKIYRPHDFLDNMIKDGYIGRKGKGGFYRLNEIDGKKVKEVRDLHTGEYRPVKKPDLESINISKGNIKKLLEHDDIGGKYARDVMIKTLIYAASLIPKVAHNVLEIDEAMKLGYNWKYGPFELIDKIGGIDYLKNKIIAHESDLPRILREAGDRPFYKTDRDEVSYLNQGGKYLKRPFEKDAHFLVDKRCGKTPILRNGSAKLWDVGDGVACLEFTSKMNSIDPDILSLITKSIIEVEKNFKGLVIANDADNFCVGANIGVLLFAANVAAWPEIKGIIKQGQDAYMAIKYADFPVVSALSGMALGGGCELAMHSDAIVAHVETYTGLVEVGVGIVPGWGGCKEMIIRALRNDALKRLSLAQKGGMFALSLKEAITCKNVLSAIHPFKVVGTMPAISHAFENIALAKVSTSAEEARDSLVLREADEIIMNRKRVFPRAKAKCLELAKNYSVPERPTFSLPGSTAKAALEMAIIGFEKSGKATKHDAFIARKLANVLSGGKTNISRELNEQDLLDLELEAFMELVQNPSTLDRLEHMLETGKPLRN